MMEKLCKVIIISTPNSNSAETTQNFSCQKIKETFGRDKSPCYHDSKATTQGTGHILRSLDHSKRRELRICISDMHKINHNEFLF